MTKKIISLLLCVALCLCVLAACGGQQGGNTPTTPNDTKPPVINARPGGMLLLGSGAVFQITYDSEGLVMKLESGNDNGATILSHYTDNAYIGMTCSALICELIVKSIDLGFVPHDLKSIVIKQAHGSSVPGTLFLEDIVKDAQNAVTTDAAIFLVTTSDLDEDGYINVETAKRLLQTHLGLNSADSIRGNHMIIDELYTFNATVGGRQNTYTLNAVTGSFTPVKVLDPDYDHYYDPTLDTPPVTEEIPEDPMLEEPTQGPTEPPSTQPPETENTTAPTVTTPPVQEPPTDPEPVIIPENTEAPAETAPPAQ